ncbi:tyrosine-type recombinase/integrase [Psychromonas sp. KJ10-10]|uniref:tyrosine-type recombinase/integrase n=1 Tax=Psychromonas sp. KJ10-10 TaxID=3391823 RepID=UPI0039B6CDCF
MKGKAKHKVKHVIPLTKQVMTILEFIKPISDHLDFLFPGDRNPSRHTNNETANTALKRMGFEGRLVAHGMRSIASTALNEEGFNSDLVEACLSHVNGDDVRRAYNRSEYLERRKPVLIWWSNFISQAAEGSGSIGDKKHFSL